LLFVPEKQLRLTKPQIKINAQTTENGLAITLTSSRFARNVFLENYDYSGSFNMNFFHLLPNEAKIIYFATDDKVDVARFINKLKITTQVDAFL